jgi:hypothetical protein
LQTAEEVLATTTRKNKHWFDVNKKDWLFIYGFTSFSRIFHLHEDVTIASEGLQI